MARKAIPRALRQQVRTRAHDRCEYCQHPASHACALYVCEHVLPRVLVREIPWPNWPGHVRHAPATSTPKLTPLTCRQSVLCHFLTRAGSAGRGTSYGVMTSWSLSDAQQRAERPSRHYA